MTEPGAWRRMRLVDQRDNAFYERYGRLAAAVVAVAFVVEVVRLSVRPRLGDALGLLIDAAIAAWFFWPLFRGRRNADGVIVVSPTYARLTWIAVALVVVLAAAISIAFVI